MGRESLSERAGLCSDNYFESRRSCRNWHTARTVAMIIAAAIAVITVIPTLKAITDPTTSITVRTAAMIAASRTPATIVFKRPSGPNGLPKGIDRRDNVI